MYVSIHICRTFLTRGIAFILPQPWCDTGVMIESLFPAALSRMWQPAIFVYKRENLSKMQSEGEVLMLIDAARKYPMSEKKAAQCDDFACYQSTMLAAPAPTA